MGPRLVFTVMLLAFGVALVFATLATLHQVSMQRVGVFAKCCTQLGFDRRLALRLVPASRLCTDPRKSGRET